MAADISGRAELLKPVFTLVPHDSNGDPWYYKRCTDGRRLASWHQMANGNRRALIKSGVRGKSWWFPSWTRKGATWHVSQIQWIKLTCPSGKEPIRNFEKEEVLGKCLSHSKQTNRCCQWSQLTLARGFPSPRKASSAALCSHFHVKTSSGSDKTASMLIPSAAARLANTSCIGLLLWFAAAAAASY